MQAGNKGTLFGRHQMPRGAHAWIDTPSRRAYSPARVRPRTDADTENRVHAMTCSLKMCAMAQSSNLIR